jgi:hypothetical protein
MATATLRELAGSVHPATPGRREHLIEQPGSRELHRPFRLVYGPTAQSI